MTEDFDQWLRWAFDHPAAHGVEKPVQRARGSHRPFYAGSNRPGAVAPGGSLLFQPSACPGRSVNRMGRAQGGDRIDSDPLRAPVPEGLRATIEPSRRKFAVYQFGQPHLLHVLGSLPARPARRCRARARSCLPGRHAPNARHPPLRMPGGRPAWSGALERQLSRHRQECDCAFPRRARPARASRAPVVREAAIGARLASAALRFDKAGDVGRAVRDRSPAPQRPAASSAASTIALSAVNAATSCSLGGAATAPPEPATSVPIWGRGSTATWSR